MITEQELIHIGRILRTHGTSGDLQCRMLNTLWEDNDAEFIVLSLEQIFVPFRVTDWRTKGADDVLLRLDNVTSEQQASRYIGTEAYMLRRDLPEGEREQVEPQALTGFTIVDAQRGAIGVITAIDTSTINTLAELDNGALLPLHEHLIDEIDTETKTVRVHLPEGLV